MASETDCDCCCGAVDPASSEHKCALSTGHEGTHETHDGFEWARGAPPTNDWRELQPNDIAAIVASRAGWQVGDFIEPLVDGNREVLRVIERRQPKHGSVRYCAEDVAGRVHDVWIMDDPRRVSEADAAEWQAARAASRA